jgi:hypothetical protein
VKNVRQILEDDEEDEKKRRNRKGSLGGKRA